MMEKSSYNTCKPGTDHKIVVIVKALPKLSGHWSSALSWQGGTKQT
jgi:hypothetical protein